MDDETANAQAVADLFGGLVAWQDSQPEPDLTIRHDEWDRALAEAKSGAPVDEAALREELAARAQDITAKITRGEIRHGLPAGYRFEFTPIDYRVADRMDLAAQVRGTAPEPPPDGFLIPPGFAEDLRTTIAELFGVPAGLFEPGPPPTRRQRLRWKRDAWRERTARRAYKVIAGYWPDNGEDDW